MYSLYILFVIDVAAADALGRAHSLKKNRYSSRYSIVEQQSAEVSIPPDPCEGVEKRRVFAYIATAATVHTYCIKSTTSSLQHCLSWLSIRAASFSVCMIPSITDTYDRVYLVYQTVYLVYCRLRVDSEYF